VLALATVTLDDRVGEMSTLALTGEPLRAAAPGAGAIARKERKP